MKIKCINRYGLEIWAVYYHTCYITEFLSEYKAREYAKNISRTLKVKGEVKDIEVI